MSDQFATGVHFMIFYLSFASRPKLHKYFVCLVWLLHRGQKIRKKVHFKEAAFSNGMAPKVSEDE